jgi:hypothetical protein
MHPQRLQGTRNMAMLQGKNPAHSVCIVIENFNSLRVMSGNAKVNAINNLCHDFNVDILCGCKTQVNWRMVPQDQRFHNLFGVGIETRSVVAHNINQRIQQNQFGGCAMMAMETMSPKVVDSGVDFTCLDRRCWMRVGSGTKKTCIVIAYQPCSSGRSAGTTVKDRQSQYFQAIDDARSPRTIFYEQLITQLLLWKTMDQDIFLLRDFNKNVYTGCIACHLSQDNLNLSEICH